MTSVVPPYSSSRQLPFREIPGPQWTNVPKDQHGAEKAAGGPFRRQASRSCSGWDAVCVAGPALPRIERTPTDCD